MAPIYTGSLEPGDIVDVIFLFQTTSSGGMYSCSVSLYMDEILLVKKKSEVAYTTQDMAVLSSSALSSSLNSPLTPKNNKRKFVSE